MKVITVKYKHGIIMCNYLKQTEQYAVEKHVNAASK